jgi:hypothetical protein
LRRQGTLLRKLSHDSVEEKNKYWQHSPTDEESSSSVGRKLLAEGSHPQGQQGGQDNRAVAIVNNSGQA